jgi:hypothetical protein
MPAAPGTYWALLDRYTPPVKRRTTHAKARTGCLTCKRRRVKCDEARPSCTRCTKSGNSCAGYEDAHTDPGTTAVRRERSGGSSKQSKIISAPLRPRPPRIRGEENKEEKGGRIVNLVRASLTPSYIDARDVPYFDRFRCQMIVDLGVWCGADYWRHKILGEVLRDETVRHAVLAAAAMMTDIEEQQRESAVSLSGSERRLDPSSSSLPMAAGVEGEPRKVLPVVTSLSNVSTHGRASLRHYTAALSLCRRSLAAEGVTSSTARSSLTVTFFFAVFELIQGNVGEANRLLSSGTSLLSEALSRTHSDGTPALVPDNELREIQLAFDRMNVTWSRCPYFGGQKAITTRGPGQGLRSPTRQFELPACDASVRTKQAFWNAFASDFGQFMASVRRSGVDIESEDLPALLAQRTRYLTQLRDWLPILEDLCAQHPESGVLCTTKVNAQTAIIFLNCFLDRSHLAYDAYLPVFKDIIAAYQRLLPSSEAQQDYLRLSLDVDLFPIITFTVSECRDRATRALALHVFGEITRRQALWANSGMLLALGALADLEDEGRDANGFVPPSARYSYVGSEWDIDKRHMNAIFVPVLSVVIDNRFTVRVPINF